MRAKLTSGRKALIAITGLLLGAVVAPATAQAPELAMLDGLSQGSWEIRIHGGGDSDRVCVRTGRELIQLRHSGESCSSFVIDDEPGQVTVQYSCPGNGYGRTTIRRETAQLVQISTNGSEGGQPFSIDAEARRVGGC